MVKLEETLVSKPDEGVVFQPRSETDLEEGLSYLLGHPDAKVTVMFTDARALEGWSRVVGELAPKVKEETAHSPLVTAQKLVYQSVHFIRFGENSPKPRDKVMMPSRSSDLKKTVVLRLVCDQRFCETWQKVQGNPGKCARTWMAELAPNVARKVQDSWGWELQAGAQGRDTVIKGVFRVAEDVAVQIMQLRGQAAGKQRWFVEKTSSAVLPAPFQAQIAVKWEDPAKDESWAMYADRVAKLASVLAVARGIRQLGIRKPASEVDSAEFKRRPRKWVVKNLPRDNDFQDVEDFLSGLGFRDVDIREKFKLRSRAGWAFRAILDKHADFFEFQDADGEMFTVELSRPKVANSNARCVLLPAKKKSRFTAGPGKPLQSREASSATAKEEGADAAAPTQMDAEEVDDTKDSSGKREATPATGAPAAGKQQKIGPPDGYTAQDNPGGGNCLFWAVSQALAAEGKQRTHAHLRATCVTHM